MERRLSDGTMPAYAGDILDNDALCQCKVYDLTRLNEKRVSV